MSFKDFFSKQSKEYSKYRPTYPQELFKYLSDICESHETAWDCATGNGQAAIALADYFNIVYATDASKEQLSNAFPHPKVFYSVALSENSGLTDASVDLATVATAIHWFNNENFHNELRRVVKPGGKIAVWNYTHLRVNHEVNKVVKYFFTDILKGCWDEKLTKVFEDESAYELPFKKLPLPDIKMEHEWNLRQVTDYLNTWSAVQYYINKNNKNPIELVINDLQKAWGDENEKKKINWDFFLRVYKMD